MGDVIGVTGLPCAGKSFTALHIASGVIDGVKRLLIKADDIGHEILLRADVQEKLHERFGEPFGDIEFAVSQQINMRKALAERVFVNAADLAWLEQLIHPLVTKETIRLCGSARSASNGRVIIEAALLFAAGMDRICGRILVIEADFNVRLARAASRGWDENELRRREERLIPLFDAAFAGSEKHRLARIDNSGPVGELRDALRAVLRRPV